MVGFSSRPEKALDELLKFDLISSEFENSDRRQEGLAALYTCEYINLDGCVAEHGWSSCSDQLKAFRHSLHYGYAYCIPYQGNAEPITRH